jgi:hypothetical protein
MLICRRLTFLLAAWAPLLPLGAQDKQQLRGETHWVANGAATADTRDDARAAAEADARKQLTRFSKARVESAIEQKWREQQAGGRVTAQEEASGRVVETASAELRGSWVVESGAEQDGNRFKGSARVACPERTLFPAKRLADLHAQQKATFDAYRELARAYAVDEPVLEEQTLRLAWERFQDAASALALGQWAARARRDGEALSLAAQAEAKAGDDAEILAKVTDLRREVQAHVPSVEELTAELLELARARSKSAPIEVTKVDEGGRRVIAWERADDEAVLKTWIDHEVTLHWVPKNQDGTADDGSAKAVGFTWPPRQQSNRAAAVAHLVLWRLPKNAPVWKVVAGHAGRCWARTGEVGEEQRLLLRELVQTLRATPGAAAVVDLSTRD